MREGYEQMVLDTRRQLDIAIQQITEDTVKTVGELTLRCGEAPTAVRNRHEAYGIAAEQLTKITKAVKSIQGDTAILLGTLPDPNYPAIEAVSSICNSSLEAAAQLVKATAEMQRTLRNLYTAENSNSDDPAPVDDWTDAAKFQEALPTETSNNNETEE